MTAQPPPAPEAVPEQEEQPLRALVVEQLKPDRINIAGPEPGQQGNLLLQAFVGAVGPGLFLHAKGIELDPDAAIAIGEHLAKEGRRVRTGLVVASGGPANLRG